MAIVSQRKSGSDKWVSSNGNGRVMKVRQQSAREGLLVVVSRWKSDYGNQAEVLW